MRKRITILLFALLLVLCACGEENLGSVMKFDGELTAGLLEVYAENATPYDLDSDPVITFTIGENAVNAYGYQYMGQNVKEQFAFLTFEAGVIDNDKHTVTFDMSRNRDNTEFPIISYSVVVTYNDGSEEHYLFCTTHKINKDS